jgi:hypothetical protein
MSRGHKLLTLAVLLASLAGTAVAWYPGGVQVEFSTATW